MPEELAYYVYLLTNWNNRVMYVGVTNNLQRHLFEHKNKLVKGFTEKYNVSKLVYFEQTADVISALEQRKGNQKMAPRKEERSGRANESWLERLE